MPKRHNRVLGIFRQFGDIGLCFRILEDVPEDKRHHEIAVPTKPLSVGLFDPIETAATLASYRRIALARHFMQTQHGKVRIMCELDPFEIEDQIRPLGEFAWHMQYPHGSQPREKRAWPPDPADVKAYNTVEEMEALTDALIRGKK